MEHNVKETSRAPVAERECRHYWVIESSGGSTSRGVCKFCGEERQFYNWLPDINLLRRGTDVLEFPDPEVTEPDMIQEHAELEESDASLRI